MSDRAGAGMRPAGLRDKAAAVRIRKDDSRQTEISELRADCVSFGEHRRTREKLWPLINQCWNARRRRTISTPELNRWLKEEVDLQRGTTPKARPVRIYYITQAKTAPPTFLIFTNQKNAAAFQLRTLSGKSDSRRNSISWARRSDLSSDCESGIATATDQRANSFSPRSRATASRLPKA